MVACVRMMPNVGYIHSARTAQRKRAIAHWTTPVSIVYNARHIFHCRVWYDSILDNEKYDVRYRDRGYPIRKNMSDGT